MLILVNFLVSRSGSAFPIRIRIRGEPQNNAYPCRSTTLLTTATMKGRKKAVTIMLVWISWRFGLPVIDVVLDFGHRILNNWSVSRVDSEIENAKFICLHSEIMQNKIRVVNKDLVGYRTLGLDGSVSRKICIRLQINIVRFHELSFFLKSENLGKFIDH